MDSSVHSRGVFNGILIPLPRQMGLHAKTKSDYGEWISHTHILCSSHSSSNSNRILPQGGLDSAMYEKECTHESLHGLTALLLWHLFLSFLSPLLCYFSDVRVNLHASHLEVNDWVKPSFALRITRPQCLTPTELPLRFLFSTLSISISFLAVHFFMLTLHVCACLMDCKH